MTDSILVNARRRLWLQIQTMRLSDFFEIDKWEASKQWFWISLRVKRRGFCGGGVFGDNFKQVMKTCSVNSCRCVCQDDEISCEILNFSWILKRRLTFTLYFSKITREASSNDYWTWRSKDILDIMDCLGRHEIWGDCRLGKLFSKKFKISYFQI